jgi:PAS domain S-box-containing protein
MQDLSNLIGELREHAKHIVEERAKAEALFANIGDGAIVTDDKGYISRINKTALELIEISEDEALGKWFPKVFIATDESGQPIPSINRPITKAFLSGKTISKKMFYRTKSRKLLAVSITVSPIMIDDKPIGAIEVFRDISKEFEMDRMKSEFISIASHQLRTPATAVKNLIGLLKEGYVGKLTKEQADLIELAYASNEQQLEVVNNLLYVARADSEEVRLKLIRDDTVQLVKQCIDEQRFTIESREQKIETKLPDKKVLATMDRQFIRMVIENLLSNASKYTPDGGNISLGMTDSEKDFTLKVRDSGVGIAKQDQARLFQRFSRIDNELSTSRGGSGIGLYLVKRIAELHHGHVSVDSEPGKGSTFTIKIPKEQPSG